MEHILTGPYNKPTNNSRRPPRGAYVKKRWKPPKIKKSAPRPRPVPGRIKSATGSRANG
ncbi:MAG: hypothetical protein ACMX3H_05075 [Sodalis sp. (in: enterobacteria)]|uniref:hypothetical protein n=1 Tax=Sodalis sp. (in: enterobacteria) TaxID=1898979 RepID=UPI0039E5FB34